MHVKVQQKVPGAKREVGYIDVVTVAFSQYILQLQLHLMGETLLCIVLASVGQCIHWFAITHHQAAACGAR